MAEINALSLYNQMQLMKLQASNQSVEMNAPQAPFSTILKSALNSTSQLDDNANVLKSRYEMGDKNVGISEVMIATQKSTLALQAMVQVRNKCVQAYQDIMSMPI